MVRRFAVLDLYIVKKKVKYKHGVIANQKVGVIANFSNNYRLVMRTFGVGVARIC